MSESAYARCTFCHGDTSGQYEPACKCWDLQSHKDHEGRSDAICDGCVVRRVERIS